MVPVPAAVYLRMSSEHQQYSFENQSAAIEEYAVINDFQIIATYSDAAISGVTLRKRRGLQNLLRDVAKPDVPFRAILVYDVSRWGRFQDADESAYYEYRCKSAGVPVHYCAESFKNDGSIPSTIMKTLKRAMAGEYSRELGVKILAGQKFLARMGFKQGGIAGYGLRRIQISQNREPKLTLRRGERKNVLTDRVVLGPGPAEEIETVREIYRMLVVEGRTIHWIAEELNRKGIAYLEGGKWHHSGVDRILTHPKYAGCCVFNQRSQRLDERKVTYLPKSEWIVVPNAWETIVERSTFDQAQEILNKRTIEQSNEVLLEGLRKTLAEQGRLTTSIIERSPHTPSVNTYSRRFGGLLKAYELIGYKAPVKDVFCMRVRLQTIIMREKLIAELVKMFPDDLSVVRPNRRWRVQFRLRNGPTFSVRVAKLHPMSKYLDRWRLIPVTNEQAYLTLLGRLNSTNDDFHDLWVLPSVNSTSGFFLAEHDLWLQRGKRLANLSQLPEVILEVDAMQREAESRQQRTAAMRWCGRGAQFI
jgi:DNA invertase Pin-like site-specific DNA recombinase